MVDSQRLSAIASFANPPSNAAATIAEIRHDSLWQLNGAPADAELDRLLAPLKLSANATPRRAIHTDSLSLLWNGPGMWFVQSDSPEAVASLKQCLRTSDATLTDLSHARTILRLSGQEAATIIKKGCPVDIDAKGVDDVFSSHIGHVNVMVRCVDLNTFDLYVFRSFGFALMEWLVDACNEWKA